MKPNEITKEQKDAIHDLLLALAAKIEEALEGKVQLVMVCHPHHDPQGECSGVWVMDNEDMPTRALANLLTNAMILTEGAAIAEHLSMMRPPGETLN